MAVGWVRLFWLNRRGKPAGAAADKGGDILDRRDTTKTVFKFRNLGFIGCNAGALR